MRKATMATMAKQKNQTIQIMRGLAIAIVSMSIGSLLYGLLTYQVYYTEHLWFVYVLFLLFVVNIFMQKVGATRYALVAWLIVGLATLFVDFPHIIERTMVWGIFFEFGRIAYKYSIPEKYTPGGTDL